MKVLTVLRIIVRERRVWDGLKLISLSAVWVGLILVRAFDNRIAEHAPSTWWFYVLVGVGLVTFLILIEWLDRRYKLRDY